MTGKRVCLLPLAERDFEQAQDFYRAEGGAQLALRWTTDFRSVLRHMADFPASGSQRYADLLGLSGLRFLPTRHFPFLVFYLEYADRIDVWRVLHGRRDVPRHLRQAEPDD